MSIYYKATRPDALSFHASPNGKRPKYEVGRRVFVPESRRVKNPRICTSAVIHASDTPSETLTSGSWPCRLFEVSGTAVVGPDSGHKLGFVELRVEREIEAWRALGPNGQEIAAYIERLKGLDAAAWTAVRVAVRVAVVNVGKTAAWATAGDVSWTTAYDAARVAACNAAGDAAWTTAYAAKVTVWDGARDPAWATRALCVRDLISAEEFDVLYGPWEPIIPAASLGSWDTLKPDYIGDRR